MEQPHAAHPSSEESLVPALSVIVPTFGRGETIQRLLERLGEQSIAFDQFEVIVVDDGSDPPVSIDASRYPFECTTIWQCNRGPASARNRALGLVRAPLTLILNDDAVPARDLLDRHLAAHRDVGPKTAVLGTFHFTEEARQSPFVRVMDGSDLLFAFTSLEHGKRYGWTYFWTCNISLRTSSLIEVQGFDDATFDRAICEDVELGYRLEQRGHDIVFREDCVAWHDHELTFEQYNARSFQLGRYNTRFAVKHDQVASTIPKGMAVIDGSSVHLRDGVIEGLAGAYAKTRATLASLQAIEEQHRGAPITTALAQKIYDELRDATCVTWLAGIAYELSGIDARDVEPVPGVELTMYASENVASGAGVL